MTDTGVTLDLQNVRKTRSATAGCFALHIPRLAVRRGELVVVRGPSGSGKSTLLDLLAMTLEPDRGAEQHFLVRPPHIEPIDIPALWRSRRRDGLAALRNRLIGYVLQTGGLLRCLTVQENIALPARLQGGYRPERVRMLAEQLDILPLLRRLPASLSVGERQRVAIARALAASPIIVIADEPTASLDPVNADRVLGILVDLVHTAGVSAIVATHAVHPILESAATVYACTVTRDEQGVRSVLDPALPAWSH